MMGMTAAEKEAALKQYRKARKSFTNKERLAPMKSMSNKGAVTLPQKSQLGIFKDPNKIVRLMEYVESHSLLKGHTFQLKKKLQICIAEEANLRLIKAKTIRSNSNNRIIAGRNFYVCANILFSMVGKLQKHAAEKVTISASFHKITGSQKRRVLNSIQVKVGLSCALECN